AHLSMLLFFLLQSNATTYYYSLSLHDALPIYIYYQYDILELIKLLNEEHGLTIVMVLHDLNQAIRYSDEIIAMKAGNVIAQGDPNQLITDHLIHEIYGVDVLVKKDETAGLYTIPVGI